MKGLLVWAAALALAGCRPAPRPSDLIEAGDRELASETAPAARRAVARYEEALALLRREKMDHHIERIDHHPPTFLWDFHSDDPRLGEIQRLFHLDPKRLGSGVYRHGVPDFDAGSKVLFYRDGKTASIGLAAHGSQVTIATNGKPDASIEMDPTRPPTIDEVTMVMAGALAGQISPETARRVYQAMLAAD